MTTLIAILAILVMLVGLAGSILPILPGLPLIWAAYLGFGLFDHWEKYSLTTMLVVSIVVILGVIFDQLASVWGAKKFGAGKAGMIGSFVGGLAGLIFFSLPGLIVGAFAGAVVCERIFNGQEMKKAFSAGAGALLGLLCGAFGKFIVSSILILAFIYFII
ncbi:MAG: DUF456 domain-containing protein [Deltaproteobacteria bacterium]|jgi:uncharacterized protein YqgC (DUF456 family)|nr:DUF456 domain-containing protein [Deltaproteobacteria bacterium]